MTEADHAPIVTDPQPTEVTWKPDWPEAKQHHIDWWHRRGLALAIDAPLPEPRGGIAPPAKPDTLAERWLDPAYRARRAESMAARMHFGGDRVPTPHCLVSAGDLAGFLGAEFDFAPSTVWHEPVIDDPEAFGPLRFDPAQENVRAIYEMLAACKARAAGRYLIGLPDLIENLDILSAMRGPQAIMEDLMDRPGWVEEKMHEIQHAWFDAYDLFYDLLREADGAVVFEAFGMWGPGKVAKVQCDAAALIGPDHFARFVTPVLTAQCNWLDYSMYHLDGTQAMVHLEALLAIESLDAIEWTPQSGRPAGGDPCWYELYRRIRAGGKAVQAIGVRPDQVVPLLDTIGPEGLYIQTRTDSVEEAERLIEQVRPYRG